MNSNKKVFIGPVAPPLGGVANHIERYTKKHNVGVIDTKTIKDKSKTRALLLEKNADIYLHSPHWYVAFLLIIKSVLLNRKCAYYFINHNFPSIAKKNKGIKQRIHYYLLFAFIKRCKKIYVVNKRLIPGMKKAYGDLHYKVLDPFVPPDTEEEESIIGTYEPALLSFIKKCSPILCSGACQLSFHEGEDLYGLDMLIEMMSVVKNTHNHIGLVFFLGDSNNNKQYVIDCEKKIEQLGLTKNIHIENNQKKMWPITKRADLFIRATNTDGDPLSVKEALFLNTEVLASDCTTRAPGVRLFKTRDIHSLTEATLDILAKKKKF